MWKVNCISFIVTICKKIKTTPLIKPLKKHFKIFTEFTSTRNIIDASTSPKAFKADYETVKKQNFQENLTMIGTRLQQEDFEKLFNDNPPFSESFYKDTPAQPISYIYGSEP